MKKIFFAHSSNDKEFVRKLAKALEIQGFRCWLDEDEIFVGDSLFDRIKEGLDSVDFVAVVLSPDSVVSQWVQRELAIAVDLEKTSPNSRILPILYRACEMPTHLADKRYADFTEDAEFVASLESLVRSMGLVFNRSAFDQNLNGADTATTLDRAYQHGLFLLPNPFHRPMQYIGMAIDRAAAEVGATPNSVGNMIVESEDAKMLLEAEGNYVSYVDVTVKGTGPHYQDKPFDPKPALAALSISANEFEFIRNNTHSHVYYDHGRKLKISVMCLIDGEPLSVGFSRKNYGH